MAESAKCGGTGLVVPPSALRWLAVMATVSGRSDQRPLSATDPVAAVAARLDARRDELADRIVARIRSEIPDYRLVDADLLADVRSITFSQLVLMLEVLGGRIEQEEAEFTVLRDGGDSRHNRAILAPAREREAASNQISRLSSPCRYPVSALQEAANERCRGIADSGTSRTRGGRRSGF